jgi:hypothetical protein
VTLEGISRLASSHVLAALAGLVLLSGCASVFEGTTQQISVTTTPEGARCTFWRNGALLTDIATTPGSVTIRKTRDDLTIVCDKRGVGTATYINRSGFAMATFANILTGGLAWAYDSTRGADNKYESDVTLTLAPANGAAPEAAQPEYVPPQAVTARSTTRSAEPAPLVMSAPPPMPPAPPRADLDCLAADGSRIRVQGNACPAGWTVTQ